MHWCHRSLSLMKSKTCVASTSRAPRNSTGCQHEGSCAGTCYGSIPKLAHSTIYPIGLDAIVPGALCGCFSSNGRRLSCRCIAAVVWVWVPCSLQRTMNWTKATMRATKRTTTKWKLPMIRMTKGFDDCNGHDRFE